MDDVVGVVGEDGGDIQEWVISLVVSLCPQQLPKRNPSTQVPRCFPSVLMHSHTNMHVPSSPTAFVHGLGLIFRQSFPEQISLQHKNYRVTSQVCYRFKIIKSHFMRRLIKQTWNQR